MAFEKVEGNYTDDAKISLRKSGTVGFNEALIQEFFVDVDNVEIYFDADNNKIGFKAINEPTKSSYKISEQSSGGTVGCTAFLKRHDLVPAVTTRYEPSTQKINDDVELIVIDLDDELDTYGSQTNSDDDESIHEQNDDEVDKEQEENEEN